MTTPGAACPPARARTPGGPGSKPLQQRVPSLFLILGNLRDSLLPGFCIRNLAYALPESFLNIPEPIL
jgi:hypothetical protein